jgi:translation initiation factor IF-2
MIRNNKGEQFQSVGPSRGIEIVGLKDLPEPGDHMIVVDSERRAKEVSQLRQRRQIKRLSEDRQRLLQKMERDKLLNNQSDESSMEDQDQRKEVMVVIKSDSAGKSLFIHLIISANANDAIILIG